VAVVVVVVIGIEVIFGVEEKNDIPPLLAGTVVVGGF
jgi:type IV secretory pathway VirB2 component (pilin)